MVVAILRGIQAWLVGTFTAIGLVAIWAVFNSGDVTDSTALMTLCALVVGFLSSLRTVDCDLSTIGKVVGVTLSVLAIVFLLYEHKYDEYTLIETVGGLLALVVIALPTGAVLALAGWGLCWIVGKLRGERKGAPTP